MKCFKINSPKLLFGNNAQHKIPIKGLELYGPYDGKVKVHMYIIMHERWQSSVAEVVNDIKEQFKVLLKSEIIEEDSIKYSHLSQRGGYEEILKKILEWRKENKWPKVILHLIRRRDDRPDGEYWKIRKWALNRYGDLLAIPVQALSYDKWLSSRRYSKKTFRKSEKYETIPQNLAVAIYAKVGLRPWILAENVSKCFKSAIYVGYDISYSEKYGQRGLGGVVVFDARGQVIEYFDVEIQVEKGDKIVPGSFREFLERIIDSAKASNITPDAIIFHRDGDFKPDELYVIDEYLKEQDIGYIFLSLPKRHAGFPVFVKEKDSWKIVESGFALYIGKQLVGGSWYQTYCLQTLGSDIPLGVIPNMLKYRCVKAGNIKSCNNLEEDIARQMLFLSRLNYATKFGFAKPPITVHYAHRVANLKRYGIALAEFKKIKVNKPVWMI